MPNEDKTLPLAIQHMVKITELATEYADAKYPVVELPRSASKDQVKKNNDNAIMNVAVSTAFVKGANACTRLVTELLQKQTNGNDSQSEG